MRSIRVRKLLLVLSDTLLVNLSPVIALAIRYDGQIPPHDLNVYFMFMAVPQTVLLLWLFLRSGLYSSVWRYASVEELTEIIKSVTIGTLPLILVIFTRLVPGMPRSFPLLTWGIDLAFVSIVRFTGRLVRRAVASNAGEIVPDRRRVLIVGAGDAGAMVAREIAKHEHWRYWPLGFVDDDPHKQGLRVAGLRVLGTLDRLEALIESMKIDDVVLAMPSAPKSVIRAVNGRCAGRVRLRTVPSMVELLDGQVTVSQIRDIKLEDLLGREAVRIDLDAVATYLTGAKVLITGAGGSIGSELCRQVARFRPEQIILLGNEENSIFEVQLEMATLYPGVSTIPVIATIRERRRMAQIFHDHRPTVVFHAAAHKHVPLMEQHPDEAVKNNIAGTRICAELALEYDVSRFVFISTDKAVNPSSVMGASKRVAEAIVQSLSGGSTRFMAVRFGNVLGSRGSVVPTFQRQIAQGGPVTITHPDMERFFMTIPEAVSLVIQAGAMGHGGEMFVLDMGEPVKILELARNLIRLSGHQPDGDIPITFTGIRPGEKLTEELFTSDEALLTTRHSRIFVSPVSPSPYARIRPEVLELEHAAEVGDRARILSLFERLIPEYRGRVEPRPHAEDRAALSS